MDISIIVPVYNVVDYVDRCIESIINQSMSEYELIIIDDGSDDGSREKCKEWAQRDSRIILIEQSNQGVSAARNRGITISQGEFIVFVDGDDYLDKTFLNEMMKCFGEYPQTEIVACGYKYDNGGKISDYGFFKFDKVLTSSDRDELICRAIGVYDEKIDRKTHIGVPWAKIYRRSFIEKNSIRFDMDMPRMQDLIFNIRCFKNINFVRYIDKPLYYYVFRQQSTANGYSLSYVEQAKLILLAMNKELYDWNSERVKETVSYKGILLLIEAIRLMYVDRQCTYSTTKKIKKIKKMCSEEPFSNSISSSYRVIKNSFSRNIFLYALKLRLYFVAYLLVWIKYKSE